MTIRAARLTLNAPMERVKKSCLLTALILAALWSFTAHAATLDQSSPEQTLTLKWEAVEGAVAYIVQIVDQNGAAVLERTVPSAALDFYLPQGDYRLRIGVINKFEKFWYWSDWEDIRVVKRTLSQIILHMVGLRISAGPVYSRVMSPWDRYLANSFSGASLNLGVYSDYRYLRWFGLELDLAGAHYRGGGDLAVGNIMTGGGVVVKTAFNFPLNALLRAGGGVAFTRLAYPDPFTGKEVLLWDSYPYYKAGAALEFRFYGDYFIEAGANHVVTVMPGNDLKTVEGFVRIGVRMGTGMSDEERGMAGRKELVTSAPVAVRISAGYCYGLLLPEWSKFFDNSPAGGNVTLALMGRRGFMRHIGIEYEAGAAFYNAKSGPNTLSHYGSGANLLYLSLIHISEPTRPY